MKKQVLQLSAIAVVMMSLSGCAVVGGIFKAGMVWGIILSVIVVFALIYLLTRGGRNR